MENSLHMINYCVFFYAAIAVLLTYTYIKMMPGWITATTCKFVQLCTKYDECFGTNCVLRTIISRVEWMLWKKTLPSWQCKILESTMSKEILKVAPSKKLVYETCQPVTCTSVSSPFWLQVNWALHIHKGQFFDAQ